MPEPGIFEITVQSTTETGKYRAVAEWSVPDGLPIRRERVFTFEWGVLPGGWDRVAYGQALGRMIFADGVAALFAQAQGSGDPLRVLLAVEAKELQSLHWQRLTAPFDGADDDAIWPFVGQMQQTPFSLYLSSGRSGRFPPFGPRDLRALVVVANPPADNAFGLEPFDEAEAINTVLKGLGGIPATVLGKDAHRAKGPATLTEICKQLTDERHTLLHVVAHGVFKEGKTLVYLDGGAGKIAAVTATELIKSLSSLGTSGLPHFAFLSVCESATPESEDALGGLGQRLVRELGMPTVIAMTERVSQRTALVLSREVYARLKKHGVVDRALVEACVEVQRAGDVTVPALFSRLGGRPLFSDDLDRPLTQAEIEHGAGLLDALFEERAPVLRMKARELVAAVRVDPAALTQQGKRQQSERIAELEALCERGLELSFSALSHGREAPSYGVRCPFPGLRAFTENEREFFRGRDSLVALLLERFHRQPFLAVLGNSGCGKSSLVMAGVIPRLQEANSKLEVVQLRPGEHPLAKLDETLHHLEGVANAVLYFDQFEESFTLCREASERRKFFDRLLDAVTPNRRIVVSMRADFIGECAEHKGLREKVEGLTLIPAMTADELRNAIEEQAKVAGLRYETGLCELILENIKHEPGAMPLLQHALRELYERRHGRWLRVKAYDELGRVEKSISTTAENVWRKLQEQDRERLRRVFLELAEVRKTEGGDRVHYLRRRVSLQHLYATSPSEESEIKRLIDLLAGERLLVKSHDAAVDAVEVAHEALLRGWGRLQDWLMASLDAIWLRQEMEASEARWNHKPLEAFLEHTHERGELVRSFLRAGVLKLDPGLERYFAACEAKERRQREAVERHTRELEIAKDKALVERDRARDATWMAYVRTFKREDPTRALLGLREVKSEHTPGWRSDVLDTLQRPIAQALLIGHAGMVVFAGFSPDGTRVVTASQDQTARVWNTDGSGESVALQGHTALVNSVSFSPNGIHVVTASGDKTARVWNADGSGEPVILKGHGGEVLSTSFSPDGRRVLTASRDGTARIWNADGSGQPVVLEGHAEEVRLANFSLDGKRVVTASWDMTARVWNVDGSEVSVLQGHVGGVSSANFSPDGRCVVTASADGTARVWNADGSDEPVVLQGHERWVRSASFSPDSRRVVTASVDGTARVWNADGRGEPVVLKDHKGPIWSASFSPNGKHVVTASEDGTAQIWNADGTGASVVLQGHEGAVFSAIIDLDGKHIVTASEDGTARVWNVDGNRVAVVLDGHEDAVYAASFSPKGVHVVTSSLDGTARVWKTDGSGEPVVLGGHEGAVYVASFSPHGAHVVTASRDGTARVWKTDGSGEPVVLGGHKGAVYSVSFNPDGMWVVTASHDGTARVWKADGSGEPVVLDGHEGAVYSASFNPSGTHVVTASQDGTARVWKADGSGMPVVLEGHGGEVDSASFSPDGTRVVTASQDGTARVWKVDGSGEPVVLEGHKGVVFAASFSPDGTRVLTASQDRTARVWKADGSEAPMVLQGHKGLISSASFSPDGTRVLTASGDNTARLWEADGSGVPLIFQMNGRPLTSSSFSPDGTCLVMAANDNMAQIWSIDTSSLRKLLEAATPAFVPEKDRTQYLGETPEEAHRACLLREASTAGPVRGAQAIAR